MDVAIIGAGASGIFSALAASVEENQVTLFDHNASIGKKLLVTGSGRCNLSNKNLFPEAYSCADPTWMRKFLNSFPLSTLINLLNDIGIPAHHSEDGWYYPLSNSAHSVVEVLKEALKLKKVELCLSTHVTGFSWNNDHYRVHLPSGEPAKTRPFDKLVVAAGGKAYPQLGSKGELFPSIEAIGHSVLPLLPALGPLTIDLGQFKRLQGMRLDVGSAIYDGETCLGKSRGNTIITSWGMNGPGIMNLSHLAARQFQNDPRKKLTLKVNLLEYFYKEFHLGLENRAKVLTSLKTFMEGFFVPQAASLLLELLKLPAECSLQDLKVSDVEKLLEGLMNISFVIQGVRGFEQSQLSAGGVPVTEVDPLTLESRLIPGLYLVGETLDVVGPCGGYNLHFAFGSGNLAGRHLAGLS